jgi:hypothetical protein
MTFLVCLASVVITSCNFSTEQKGATLEQVETNLNAEDAIEDLAVSSEDSVEFANYKIESEITLRGNELLIAGMKDRMKSGEKETIVKYKATLDSLEMQNSRLRSNLQMYSAKGKVKWELFKANFNRELDSLGKSISRLTERNMNKG